MTDRHLLGDVALALLIAIPAVALARPESPQQTQAAPGADAHTLVIATADRPVGLLR